MSDYIRDTISCRLRGGRSRKTGKPVGVRHRWNGQTCIWCGSFKDEVRIKRLIKPNANPDKH